MAPSAVWQFSMMASRARRQRAWDALAELLDRDKLSDIYSVISLSEVPEAARKIVNGEIRGRIVVDINA